MLSLYLPHPVVSYVYFVVAYKLWPDWGLSPGLLDIYQVLFQLSYIAWGHQSEVGILLPLFCHFEFMDRLHIQHIAPKFGLKGGC